MDQKSATKRAQVMEIIHSAFKLRKIAVIQIQLSEDCRTDLVYNAWFNLKVVRFIFGAARFKND